jgi:hypothetical protein
VNSIHAGWNCQPLCGHRPGAACTCLTWHDSMARKVWCAVLLAGLFGKYVATGQGLCFTRLTWQLTWQHGAHQQCQLTRPVAVWRLLWLLWFCGCHAAYCSTSSPYHLVVWDGAVMSLRWSACGHWPQPPCTRLTWQLGAHRHCQLGPPIAGWRLLCLSRSVASIYFTLLFNRLEWYNLVISWLLYMQ